MSINYVRSWVSALRFHATKLYKPEFSTSPEKRLRAPSVSGLHNVPCRGSCQEQLLPPSANSPSLHCPTARSSSGNLGQAAFRLLQPREDEGDGRKSWLKSEGFIQSFHYGFKSILKLVRQWPHPTTMNKQDDDKQVSISLRRRNIIPERN